MIIKIKGSTIDCEMGETPFVEKLTLDGDPATFKLALEFLAFLREPHCSHRRERLKESLDAYAEMQIPF